MNSPDEKLPYEKPEAVEIDLKADQVLAKGCKTGGGLGPGDGFGGDGYCAPMAPTCSADGS